MNFTLKRNKICIEGVFGELYDGTGKLFCVTLEHAFPVPGARAGTFRPKVAAGTYKCTIYDSPKHGYKVFVLNGVPDFLGHPVTFIEIHIGNFNRDSDGCILLGATAEEQMITRSAITFNKFMELQAGLEEFTLTIE